ncbi:mechanosensitive ion channel [Aureococcus anophagefferens]|nr:mechanosensitive ion channel [Aureococcus anophagefferens]
MLLLAASVGAAPRRLPPARVALRVRGGQVAEAGDPRLHLAGKLFPALRRTVLTSEKCGLALTKVLDAAAFADFAVIASIGLAATPIMKFLRASGGPATLNAVGSGCPSADLPLIAASLAYPIWLANLCSALKAKALGMREKTSEARHIEAGVDGKTLVYNRLLDFGIFVFAALGALEVLSLELGVAFTSLIAVSGVSSVVVARVPGALTHLINGLLLTFNDKFQPGEEVKFGDVAGFVTSMGWFDTHVRRYDESTASEIRVVQIPNGKIMGQELTNLSRQTWGQYKTELRIRLEDMPRMEAVVAAIRADLAAMPGSSSGRSATSGSTGAASTATPAGLWST